jgi:ribosome maturation protein SDO1
MLEQGVLAKSKDMKAAFGTDDVDDVIKIILAKGELQVSDKERESLQER